jgi:glycosyltransferase involved in cell wall biosynthesis
MRFSVVIPTMRREQILADTLASLENCDPPPDEVIVVDSDEDGSSQPVVTAFDNAFSRSVRYHRTAPSLTRQRNLGIDDSSGEIVVFLDDDVTVPARLFARLQDVYEDGSVVGATGKVVEPQDDRRLGPLSPIRRLLLGRGKEGTFTRYGYPRYLADVDRPQDVEFMRGCFMSARREAATTVRFDEQLGGYALAEDEDFSYRLSRLGRIRYAPEIVVQHRKLGFGSQDPRRLARLVVVNRAYLFRKNFPGTVGARAQFALFVGMLVAHRIANRQWRGAQGVLEGARDAWRARPRGYPRQAPDSSQGGPELKERKE